MLFTFILASLMFLFTGGAVILLCTWNHYEDALVTFIGGVVITALIGGTPLLFSKGELKMEENSYITINFTEKEIDEILVEYYGLEAENQSDKEWLEDAKAGLSEDDFKRIILEKIL